MNTIRKVYIIKELAQEFINPPIVEKEGEIKVKGIYGDWRVFGNFDKETGHIIFDMFGKGKH
ncbi:hypothetical protein P8V03_09850 [Clostridium sp. A1-XYC3]|uniref:Uncharacterized protein n=1 Tax=Clostridium tanneri TaxID=3037988 RepID=A0ABU4JTH3_9CLOT|nr:hypothetical protein [Clostridium sp. A1-XYC3]MDW8801457.1 hypothetical protein [Clostridium sp. A1-XYC3]